MLLALVAAVADNGVIGRGGALPWHLPDDLRHFKALTMGKPVLMGRRTYESIGKPLPGRRNLVLSHRRSREPRSVNVLTATSLQYCRTVDQALAACAGSDELCVIGGAAVFAATLPRADVIHLTRVHAAIEGDVLFPALDGSQWQEIDRLDHPADARHQYAMSFITLRRQ